MGYWLATLKKTYTLGYLRRFAKQMLAIDIIFLNNMQKFTAAFKYKCFTYNRCYYS